MLVVRAAAFNGPDLTVAQYTADEHARQLGQQHNCPYVMKVYRWTFFAIAMQDLLPESCSGCRHHLPLGFCRRQSPRPYSGSVLG